VSRISADVEAERQQFFFGSAEEERRIGIKLGLR
jgi:hypothetical protein